MKKHILLFLVSFILLGMHASATTNGAALDFNGGTGEFINTNVANFGTSDLTIELDIKTNSSDNMALLGKRSGCGGGGSFWDMLVYNGAIYVEFYNGSASAAFGGTTYIPDGQWHHIALVRSAGIGTLYVDGQVDGSAPLSASIVNNQHLQVGTYSCNGTNNVYEFSGQMDELRIWSQARTQLEINAHKSCEIIPQPGLETYCQFNQGIAGGNNTAISTLTDMSGHGNDANLLFFNMQGSNDNFVSPGAVASGVVCCTPSVSITCNNTNLNVHSNIVFTSSGTNMGTRPNFNWYLNGSMIAGVHSSTMSYGGALGDGDQIYCTMTPTIGCAIAQTAVSNTVTFTKSGSSAKAITTLTMPAQVGSSVIDILAATVSAVVTTAPAGRTSIHPTRLYLTPGATYGPSYAVNRDFSHPVTYTVVAQNGTTKVWTVTVLDQSGNKTNSAIENATTVQAMSLYPNPSASYINVTANGGTATPVITILDIEGRVMYHQALPVTETIDHQIDLSDFATGMYFVHVAVGERTETKSFVVKKD